MNVYPYCVCLLSFVTCVLNAKQIMADWSKIIIVGLCITILMPFMR